MKDSRKRSIAKTTGYRIICIILAILIPYILTREWKFAFQFAVVHQSTLVVIYYVYERIWNKIDWGKY